MADTNKTQPTNQSVEEFLNSIENVQRQVDSRELVKIMQQVTGSKPVMWGPSMVGFGTNHYKYASGREGDTMAVGFAPRKEALVLYGLIYYERNTELLGKLGTHNKGKGCLYIGKLGDIDIKVLKKMIKKAFDQNNNS